MNLVRGNWADSIERDVPWPGGEEGEDETKTEGDVAKFWAHDVAGMDRMDREMDAAAMGEVDEVERLQQQMASDYEGYVRSGGADRLLELTRKVK